MIRSVLTPSPTAGLAKSPWGYCLVDQHTGRFVYTNETFRMVFGLSENGVNEHTVDTLFKIGKTSRAFDEITEAVGRLGYWKGRICTFADRKSLIDVEAMIEPAAEMGQYEVHLLEHPRIGRNLHFSSRSEMKMLRLLMEFTVDILLIRDHSGRILLANRAFRKAAGVTYSASLLEQSLESFFDELDRPRIKEIDALVSERRKTVTLPNEKLRFKNGNVQWWVIHVVPANTAGNPAGGTVFSMRCITEQRQREIDLKRTIKEANESSQAKTEFLSTISHEIRTPINGIIGAAELCLDHELDDDLHTYTDTILNCGNDLLAIINDVLDFAKIDSGSMDIAHEVFELKTTLHRAFTTHQEAAKAKGLRYELELDGDLPETILGDSFRLRQSIQNLLSNAVKFTDEGSVTLRCKLTSSSRFGVTLCIEVIDTGIGIDEEEQASIFESFRQGDMSPTRKYGGTGLGLSISSELVHLMGGTLDMSSKPGQGSSFVIVLPCELPTAPQLAGLSEPASSDTSGHAGKEVSLATMPPLRVLLVEDNAVNRVIAERRLHRIGHTVTIAANGREAVEQVIKDPPEIILMDVEMPEMDGLEATRQIRAHEAKTAQPPVYIIAITAHAQATDRERCLKSGMNDYLSKPFRSDKFVAVLERASAYLASSNFSRAPAEASGRELETWFDSLDSTEKVDIVDAAQIFCETVGDEVESLRRAQEQKDFSRLHRIAHQMRGVAAIFKADRAVEMAAQLETNIQGRDWARIQKNSDALESELLRLERNLLPLIEREAAISGD